MLSTLILAVTMASSPAHAKCDSQLKTALRSKGITLARAFENLAKCDPTIAEENYLRLMTQDPYADTIIALSQAAIKWDIWNPVYQQLAKISSYDTRDEIAQRIGESCGEKQKVPTFLQGAYFGLRDIDFQQWDDAFISCTKPELEQWVIQQVEKPPEGTFNEKYNLLMGILIEKQGAKSLETLAKAAVRAAPAGPFDAVLMKMDEAVAPSLGDAPNPQYQAALEKQLVRVAQAVGPDKARSVADRLANAGHNGTAAKLLPSIYPDQVQSDGGFLYGAVSVERGECKGEKTAVLHSAKVEDPGTRWVILADVNAPILAVKPKLTKCTPEDGEWPVATTPEPVSGSKDIDKWIKELTSQWEGNGYAVKVQGEKTIKLP